MLPFSLEHGWTVMGDNRTLKFDAIWDGEHVQSTVDIDGDEIKLIPTEGSPALVMRLDQFELLAPRVIVAAHTTSKS